MSKKGGKPVNSGGFGCIFKPPLKCSNSSPPGNYVSKLMTKEDAIACVLEHSDTTEDDMKANLDAQIASQKAPTLTSKTKEW